MKHRLVFYAAAGLALSAVGCSEQPLSPALEAPAFTLAADLGAMDLSDRYLVRFADRVLPTDLDSRVADVGGTVVYSHGIGIAIVSGLTADAAAALGAYADVAEIRQDATFELDPALGGTVEVAGATPASPGDPTTAFWYPRQWNMRAIRADQAWAAGRHGSAAVTIAILDTGIDYLYPDLAGRVDLTRSVSFVPFDDDLVSLYFPTRHPITDLHYHGTHVASTAVSNSDYIAGVTSMTTLIGVKVCSVTGGCAFSSVIAGVLHATDAGADVANMSLGGLFAKAQQGRYVGFINSVLNYANSRGMTIVVSAGNSGLDLDHDGDTYKTYCSTPNTICVSATGPTASAGFDGPWTDVDAIAPYSNYGRSVINVAAPGGTTAAYVWAACSQTSLVLPICGSGPVYALGMTGTSMAAPHVTGLASLVVEDVGRRPGRVVTVIQQTADDLGQRGTDPFYGKGRINVGNAAN